MKDEGRYRERCAARGLDEDGIGRALAVLAGMEGLLYSGGYSLDDTPLAELERHIPAILEGSGASAEERIVALARYYALFGPEALAIRLLAYLLPIGVISSMAVRLGDLEGRDTEARVMRGVIEPTPGSAPEAYPEATARFVSALESELGVEKAQRILTWNVHGVPASAFAEERERFLAAPSIHAWLEDYHGRQVQVLQRHADDGTLWFEQRITQRVVDFVRDSPEILGGRLEGDHIYVTKIPYDPDRYLGSSDPLERRRLACHCPLAASSISANGAGVPAIWCNCSAGFEKFMFDVVFGQEVKAKVLESVLAGDGRCRFENTVPASILALKPA
ncbi:MAG: hypothetical protein ABIJ86_13075 [Spirochaetota bacterium]